MPYGLIVLFASIALSAVFILVTDAPVWAKALVAGLLLFSFAWRYGLFLRVALAVCLSLYFTYLKSRSDHE
jgi:membrane protein implicated in regulation of membrane protease activity